MSWGAIAAAVIGAGGAYVSGQKQKKLQKKMTKGPERLAGLQADLVEKMSPYAVDYYKRSREAYAPAYEQMARLAGNDRTAMMGAVAPEMRGIDDRYRSMISAGRMLMPRGGANAAYNTDLAYRAGDEKQALLNQQRTAAFGGLAKMAGLAGDLGAGAAGGSTNAAAGANGLFNTQANIHSLFNSNNSAAYAELGKALADAFGKGYIGKQPGKG